MTVHPSMPPLREAPVGPSREDWRAMSPSAREAFLVGMNEVLTEATELMGEGRPHKRAKSRALDLLGLHFKAKGRTIYLAEELSVLYPGERAFAPDVLAVVDVPQTDDDERLAWVVADEGRGLDLVLEVLHHGDRAKDLVENVVRYARLGIPEYFVYDRAQQRVLGYRLTTPDARRYDRIVPQAGRYASRVLGVDLAVQGGQLRFFDGMAELFGSDDLIARLTGIVESLESKAEAALMLAEAERARAESEQARAESEQARAHAARAREQAALEGLRDAVLSACAARFGGGDEALRDALAACDDPAWLRVSLVTAVTGGSHDAILDALRARS